LAPGSLRFAWRRSFTPRTTLRRRPPRAHRRAVVDLVADAIAVLVRLQAQDDLRDRPRAHPVFPHPVDEVQEVVAENGVVVLRARRVTHVVEDDDEPALRVAR